MLETRLTLENSIYEQLEISKCRINNSGFENKTHEAKLAGILG